jgi:AcrR family transcriptional regulator
MGSTRRTELLESAYRYALAHGLADLSLRPLAAAIGSSPRVLLYLFGSKEGLIRELLTRARADEVALLGATPDGDLTGTTRAIWSWLSDPAHRALLTLWTEAYARSLIEPDGPWSSFAQETVRDWLSLLAAAQPAATRDTPAAVAERTATLALLRGALLDLLATGDLARTTAAVLGGGDGDGVNP